MAVMASFSVSVLSLLIVRYVLGATHRKGEVLELRSHLHQNVRGKDVAAVSTCLDGPLSRKRVHLPVTSLWRSVHCSAQSHVLKQRCFSTATYPVGKKRYVTKVVHISKFGINRCAECEYLGRTLFAGRAFLVVHMCTRDLLRHVFSARPLSIRPKIISSYLSSARDSDDLCSSRSRSVGRQL
jgi:hypothetical protein